MYVSRGYVLGARGRWPAETITVLVAPDGNRTWSANDVSHVWHNDRWIVLEPKHPRDDVRILRPNGARVFRGPIVISGIPSRAHLLGDAFFTSDYDGTIRRTHLPSGASEAIGQRPYAASYNRTWIRRVLGMEGEQLLGDDLSNVFVVPGTIVVAYEDELAAFAPP